MDEKSVPVGMYCLICLLVFSIRLMIGVYVFFSFLSGNDYHPDVCGRRHGAVNVAVAFVGPLLIWRVGGIQMELNLYKV